MPKLKREAGEERATDFVESLDRGLRLLQAFGNTTGPMTLSDIARAADLPRATARRTLYTLERLGFVTTDGKLFALTSRVLTLATAFGLAMGMIGALLSAAAANLPAGPIIVLVGTALFLVSALFAPRRGLVARIIERQRPLEAPE